MSEEKKRPQPERREVPQPYEKRSPGNGNRKPAPPEHLTIPPKKPSK